MLLKVKVMVLSAMVACTYLLLTVEAEQTTDYGDNVNNNPAQINYQHATYDNDRSARSVHLPLKYVFDGAKLVKTQGRTRYWGKLGGEDQLEKDLAFMYRRRAANEVDYIESFNKMRVTGILPSLMIQRMDWRGQHRVEVITYLRKWGELNGANVVKIGNTGYH